MALWGRPQLGWLRKRLAYAKGIPCKDTFRRAFSGLSRVALERCFIEWVGAPVSEPREAAPRD
ncbi:MAG: transposase family protein [Burkholderia sp.]